MRQLNTNELNAVSGAEHCNYSGYEAHYKHKAAEEDRAQLGVTLVSIGAVTFVLGHPYLAVPPLAIGIALLSI